MLLPQSHRPVHPVSLQAHQAAPTGPGRLIIGKGWPPAPGGQHDGELLPDLAVAGVEDAVARVGVDAEQAGDLALGSALLKGFPDCRLG
jgi:hypothetical protein